MDSTKRNQVQQIVNQNYLNLDDWKNEEDRQKYQEEVKQRQIVREHEQQTQQELNDFLAQMKIVSMNAKQQTQSQKETQSPKQNDTSFEDQMVSVTEQTENNQQSNQKSRDPLIEKALKTEIKLRKNMIKDEKELQIILNETMKIVCDIYRQKRFNNFAGGFVLGEGAGVCVELLNYAFDNALDVPTGVPFLSGIGVGTLIGLGIVARRDKKNLEQRDNELDIQINNFKASKVREAVLKNKVDELETELKKL